MNLDRELFRVVNGTLGWEPLAPVMKFVSDFKNFIPLLAVATAAVLWKGGRRGRVTLLALLVLVPLTDQAASHVLKPMFQRPRPCRAEAGIEAVKTYGMRCSGKGSFPSSHAANMGGVAWLVLRRHRRWGLPVALLALLVGYSRIFLGLHYPGDVLGGFLLGVLLAEGVARLSAWIEAKWRRDPLTEPLGLG